MFDTGLDVDAEERRAWMAVDNIGAEAREENACGARRLFAIGQLYEVRAPDDDVEKLCWAIDGHTSLVAEVCTALAVSRCRAAAQVKMAIALYTRLPRVLNVARSGLLDYRMLAAIVSRTELIQDPEAVRIREQIRHDRQVGGCPDGDGHAQIWGTVDVAALAAMNTVLDTMADSVCPCLPPRSAHPGTTPRRCVLRGVRRACVGLPVRTLGLRRPTRAPTR